MLCVVHVAMECKYRPSTVYLDRGAVDEHAHGFWREGRNMGYRSLIHWMLQLIKCFLSGTCVYSMGPV